MDARLLLESAVLAVAVAVLMTGALAAWTSGNATKRVVGVAIALIGALAGLAELGAPSVALIAGAAILFAYLAIGVALVVRLQEAYGAIETAEIDAADAQSEPQERAG